MKFRISLLWIFVLGGGLILLSGCTTAAPLEDVTSTPKSDVKTEESQEAPVSGIGGDPDFPIDLSAASYKLLLVGSDEPPLAGPFESISAGVQDAVQYVNSNGGIYGAELDLVVSEVSISDDNADQQILRLLDEEAPHFALLVVPVSQSLYQRLNRQTVPVLYFGIGGERLAQSVSGRDNLFWLTPYPDAQMAFVFEELRSAWESITPASTYLETIGAYLTWEEEYGGQADTTLLEDYLRNRAFQIAVKDSFQVSPNANVANALINSLSARVGVIYTDTYSFGPAVVANDAISLAMTDFFIFAGSVWSYDGINQAYKTERTFEGALYTPFSVVWWENSELPSIGLAIKIAEFSNREMEERDFGYLLGLGAVDLSVQVTEIAASDLERSEIFARELYEYLSDLEDYPVMQGLFEVDYSDRNRALKQLQLWHYENGEWEALGEMKEIPELILNGNN